MQRHRFLALLLSLGLVAPLAAQQATTPTDALKAISPHVAGESEREQLRGMLGRSLREQIVAANRASSEAWSKIQTREDWEQFRAAKLALLRKSLGTLPPRPAKPKTLVTGRIDGDGFQIQNLVYESRPGLVVTANLYVPVPPREKMPGIAIVHSHHNPKHEGELQDMGMTWARAGCYVLVPDALGHGERRQHPFASAVDYPKEFAVGRQDYNFRYDTSLQLYLVGETLMGWMVHDLMTGFDMLMNQPGIDDSRLILLGSVAGGGDPAGVTAALDERIDCVVPFNFGGPQPENRFPLPEDAETSFNYAGGGSWESTRNLYRSAADGFLPWAIVGSVAPRKVIHAHEFSWDRERDPVWKRYEKIYGFYNAKDNLAFTTGFGTIQNTQAPASHCNNIGPPHRKLIHEAFAKWFGIQVTPETEYKGRRTREELTCLTEAAKKEFQPKPLHEILAALADESLTKARAARLTKKQPVADSVRGAWQDVLGNVEPPREIKSRPGTPPVEEVGGLVVYRELLDVQPGITIPVLTLQSKERRDAKAESQPAIVAFAPDGIAGVLERRQSELALGAGLGYLVVLADLRGMGAASGSNDAGQQSGLTSYSASQLMLGEPLLAGQLRDLRAVIRHIQQRPTARAGEIVVMGGCGVDVLARDAAFPYPRRVERPAECQPAPALLALLAMLYEPKVTSGGGRRGLVSYRSILDTPFVQVPHAAIPPGLLRQCDLPDLVAVLTSRAVTLDQLVDGLNRQVPAETARQIYKSAESAFEAAGAGDKLKFTD